MRTSRDKALAPNASEQAADWFLRLQEPDCAAGDRSAFERWHAADPVHAAAYRRVQRLWADASELAREDPVVCEAAQRALYRRSDANGTARRVWGPALAAAAALAVVAIAGGWWLAARVPAGTQYATGAGEQRSIVLSDGSRLTLDTRTVLIERYNGRKRRVDLQQGQAEFQVRSDPSHPFVVHTQGGTVSALGTRFQVRVGADTAVVTLLEGRVRVAAPPAGGDAQTTELQPGQMLRFQADGHLGAARAADLQVAQAWTEGKLRVDNWQLQALVDEINRYSDTQLRIDEPALRELPISGTFYTHDRDGLVHMLEVGWGIHAQRLDAREVLLTRR